MTLSWALPARAGRGESDRPSIQRPSAASERSAEPLAVEPAVEVEAEPAVEPSLADSSALPSYADPALAAAQPAFELDTAELVPRDVPRDGRGMQVLAGFGLLGAAGLGAGTVVLARNGVEPSIYAGPIVLAAGLTLTSALFLYGGHRRQLRYREWASQQSDVAPRQGNGMVAVGGALMIGGAVGAMFGTIGWGLSNVGFQPEGSTTPPVYPAAFGVGVASLTAGTVVLLIGMKRHRAFQAWRRETGTLAQLLPAIALLPGGGQIGLSGRF